MLVLYYFLNLRVFHKAFNELLMNYYCGYREIHSMPICCRKTRVRLAMGNGLSNGHRLHVLLDAGKVVVVEFIQHVPEG